MAIKWKSDLCNCISIFEISNGVTTGELITPCDFHETFEDSLYDNQLKNSSMNSITSIVDMTDKEITTDFNYTTGEITLILHNFTETDIDNINSLNLNVSITESI